MWCPLANGGQFWGQAISPMSSFPLYFSCTYNCPWVLQHSTPNNEYRVNFSLLCIQMTLFFWPSFCVTSVQNTNKKCKDIKIFLKNISFNMSRSSNIVSIFPLTTCQSRPNSRTFMKHFSFNNLLTVGLCTKCTHALVHVTTTSPLCVAAVFDALHPHPPFFLQPKSRAPPEISGAPPGGPVPQVGKHWIKWCVFFQFS